jgi:hypothetical protein
MNVEIGTEAPIFLFWEYLLPLFGIFSLQCRLGQECLTPGHLSACLVSQVCLDQDSHMSGLGGFFMQA